MTSAIEGFEHHKNVLSEDARHDLIAQIDSQSPWERDYSRQAHSFGFSYNHSRHSTSRADPLPEYLRATALLIVEKGWMAKPADQVTVLKYDCGSFIDPHIDDLGCFGDEIVTLSLASSCLYWLTDGRNLFATVLEAGDAVVLKGQARRCWKHGIPRPKLTGKLPVGQARIVGVHGSPKLELGVDDGGPVPWRRLSITFRTVLPGRLCPMGTNAPLSHI